MRIGWRLSFDEKINNTLTQKIAPEQGGAFLKLKTYKLPNNQTIMEKTDKKDKTDLESMKENYAKLSKKYALPIFDKISEDFDIEKYLEKETSFILRDLRKIFMEKFNSYLHLFEILNNPSSAPMFIFSMIKNIQEDDKKEIKEIYKIFSKIQLQAMKLDTIYNEKNEADFINKNFKLWQDLKKQIYELTSKFEESFNQNNTETKRGYFG